MALISARTAGLPSLGSFYDDAVDGAWCAAEGSVFQRPPLRSTGLNIGPVSGDPFKVSVPVNGFAAAELSVRVVGDEVVVEGRHEERQPETGAVRRRRHMQRRFRLPDTVDAGRLTSTLSLDAAVLIVAAPAKTPPCHHQHTVPIQISRK